MARTTRTLSAPTAVILMITRRCNLHCMHCGSSPEQFLREDMDTQEILGVIDDLERCKVFRVAITGGEPLLHPDFFAIVDAIMQRPMRLQLNTNATLVTEAVAQRLKELRRPPFVSVSLDGVSPEIHDRIRGKGSFAKAKRGIQLLVEAGLIVRPFMVMSRMNYHELPKIAEFARSVGIRRVFATTPAPCGRAPQHAAEMAFQPEELREALEIATQVLASSGELLTGPWAYMARFYRELRDGTFVWPDRTKPVTYRCCNAGIITAAIACDGTMTPCDMAYMYRVGNVRDQPLTTVWRDSPALEVVRNCLGMPLAEVRGCDGCTWQHHCRGPCPASGYNTVGTWPAAPTVCMTREIGKLFGYEPVTQDKGGTQS